MPNIGPIKGPFYNVKAYSWPSKEKGDPESGLKGEEVLTEEIEQESPQVKQINTSVQDYMKQDPDVEKFRFLIQYIQEKINDETKQYPELKQIVEDEVVGETASLNAHIAESSINEMVKDLTENTPKTSEELLERMGAFFRQHRDVAEPKSITPGQAHLLFLSIDRTIVEALVAEEICQKAGLFDSPMLHEIAQKGHLVSPALMGMELAVFASIFDKKISEVRSKQSELDTQTGMDANTIARKKQEIKQRKDEIKEYATYISWKVINYVTGAPKQMMSYLADSGQIALLSNHLSTALLAANALSAIGVLASFCFQSFYTARTLKGMASTFKEIKDLKQRLEDQNLDDTFKKILSIKLDRLQKLRDERIFNSIRMTIFTFLSAISVGIAVKTILVAAGVTIGATATVAISITGYGIIIVGGILILSGAGYLAYTQRHQIEAYMRKIPLTARRHYTSWKIKQAQGIINQSRKRMEKISQKHGKIGANVFQVDPKSLDPSKKLEMDESLRIPFERMVKSMGTIRMLDKKMNQYQEKQEEILRQRNKKEIEQKLRKYRYEDIQALEEELNVYLEDSDNEQKLLKFLHEKKTLNDEVFDVRTKDVFNYLLS